MQKAIAAIDHQNGQIELIDEDKTSADLKKAILGNTPIVATTIQKFLYVLMMRRFVKSYDFIVQASLLKDEDMHKLKCFVATLIPMLLPGSPTDNFSLKDKIDAINIGQKKVKETAKPYIEIYEALCGEGYYHDEGAIRVHISRFRAKLPKGEKIEAKRGRGYALVTL